MTQIPITTFMRPMPEYVHRGQMKNEKPRSVVEQLIESEKEQQGMKSLEDRSSVASFSHEDINLHQPVVDQMDSKSQKKKGTIIVNSLLLGFGASSEGQSLYAQLEALGLRPVFSGSPRDTEFLSPSDRLLRIRECASDFDVLLTLRSNGRIYSELLQNIAEVSTAVQKRRVAALIVDARDAVALVEEEYGSVLSPPAAPDIASRITRFTKLRASEKFIFVVYGSGADPQKDSSFNFSSHHLLLDSIVSRMNTDSHAETEISLRYIQGSFLLFVLEQFAEYFANDTSNEEKGEHLEVMSREAQDVIDEYLTAQGVKPGSYEETEITLAELIDLLDFRSGDESQQERLRHRMAELHPAAQKLILQDCPRP